MDIQRTTKPLTVFVVRDATFLTTTVPSANRRFDSLRSIRVWWPSHYCPPFWRALCRRPASWPAFTATKVVFECRADDSRLVGRWVGRVNEVQKGPMEVVRQVKRFPRAFVAVVGSFFRLAAERWTTWLPFAFAFFSHSGRHFTLRSFLHTFIYNAAIHFWAINFTTLEFYEIWC